MTPTLETRRLLLRPFRRADAAAVATLAGNWEVARMTSRVPHPYTHAAAESWIATHGTASPNGEELFLCIALDGEAIGAIGLKPLAAGTYELGYWLGEPWWGKGYISEAAARVVRFAFEALGADRLTAGHFRDNPASGRVLEKCGFSCIGEGVHHSEARGDAVAHRDFDLTKAAWSGQAERT